MKDIKEKIAVMQAYADGKKIEAKLIGCTKWEDVDEPQWNWFQHEYRIKQDVPRTWEEFCAQNKEIKTEYYIASGCDIYSVNRVQSGMIDRNTEDDAALLKSKEDAEGLLALIKLKRLHDAWCGDWKPDFDDFMTEKSFICKEYYSNDAFDFGVWSGKIRTNHLLIFKTKEIAEDFLTCFKDLIKQAEMWF